MQTGMQASRSRSAVERRHAKGTSRLSRPRTSVLARTSSGAPSRATRPCSKTMIRSASAASSMKWVIMTMVMPRSCNSLHTRIRPLRPRGFKHGGCFVKNEDFRIHGQNAGNGDALLLAARSALVSCFSKPTRPTSSSAERTRRAISAVSMPRFSGPKATSSSTREATRLIVGGFETPCPPWSGIAYRFSSSAVLIPSVATDPACGDEQRVEVFSQGRLAASVASEDADELARRDMRVDSGEDKPVSIVGEFNIGAGNHGFCSFVLFGAMRTVRLRESFVAHAIRRLLGYSSVGLPSSRRMRRVVKEARPPCEGCFGICGQRGRGGEDACRLLRRPGLWGGPSRGLSSG